MLESVIKSKSLFGKTVSILLYSIEKEDRFCEEGHTHYYEIRVSDTVDKTSTKWYTDSEYYIKRIAFKVFNKVVNEISIEGKKECDKKSEKEYGMRVFDSVTGKTFVFANNRDKENFFNTWDSLVLDVIGREDE